MSSIEKSLLPEGCLLSVYRDNGAYTDCYRTEIQGQLSQSAYIQAFYTTVPFKTERFILNWAVAKPSTDDDARLLAEGRTENFAAWHVEARRDREILLSDYRGRTRSWLMTEPRQQDGAEFTRLYFGSAVVPIRDKESDEPRMGNAFSVLLLFHKCYSRVLLAAARSRLSD